MQTSLILVIMMIRTLVITYQKIVQYRAKSLRMIFNHVKKEN